MRIVRQKDLIVGKKYKLDPVSDVEAIFRGEMLDEDGDISIAFEPLNTVRLYYIDRVTGNIHFLIENEEDETGTQFIELRENV